MLYVLGQSVTQSILFEGVTNTSASAQLAKVETVTARNGSHGQGDEFDMFAQSRNATYENSKTRFEHFQHANISLLQCYPF